MKRLSDQTKNKIVLNNKKISNLLNLNEKLYSLELTDMERRLIPVSEEERILIPPGYVRTKEYFIKNYNLKKLTDDYKQQSNIAYLMQYTDLLHYFITRFYIFGQVRNAFYFNEIVILTSILEEVLHIITERYRVACKICGNQTCSRLINKKQSRDLKSLISRLNELNIISISEDEENCLKELIELRNKIHIYLMDDTIFNNEKFSKKFFNKYLITFKSLIKSINNKILLKTAIE